jgi:hypothetical protein
MALPTAAFADLFAITRAGATATARNSIGSVVDVAANGVRYDFTATGLPRGIIVEDDEINYASNVRWTGGTAGTAPTPGSPPTGGTVGTSPTNTALANATPVNGCITRYGGNVTIGGVEFATMQLYGTAPGPASGSSQALASNIPILQAAQQDYVMQAVLLDGSWSNIEFFRVRDQALTQVDLHTRITTLNQVVEIPMPTKAAGALTDTAASFLLLVWRAITGAVNVTVGFSSIMAIRGGARTSQSLIRPNPAATGSTTRARDDLRWSRMDWWNPARVTGGTNVGAAFFTQFIARGIAGVSGDRGLWRVDDGTANNRLEAYLAAGTYNLFLRRVVAGSTVFNTQIGTVTPDVAFRLAVAADSTTIRASVSGGDIFSASMGGAFTAARGLVGSTSTTTGTALWGWFQGGIAYPYGRESGNPAMTNADLLRMVDMAVPYETLWAEANL